MFYLDFDRKVYVHMGQFPFPQVVHLRYELFLDSAIKIRYRNIATEDKKGKSGAAPNVQNKKKVKERSIK